VSTITSPLQAGSVTTAISGAANKTLPASQPQTPAKSDLRDTNTVTHRHPIAAVRLASNRELPRLMSQELNIAQAPLDHYVGRQDTCDPIA
jgi:hypothetical protein